MNETIGKEVAATIIEQLAGHWGRLKIMTGAQYPVYSESEHYFSFRFKMCKKANYCRIKLTGMDLYDVEFGKVWGDSYKVVEEFNGLYAEMLRPTFEQFTGLYLKLF